MDWLEVIYKKISQSCFFKDACGHTSGHIGCGLVDFDTKRDKIRHIFAMFPVYIHKYGISFRIKITIDASYLMLQSQR